MKKSKYLSFCVRRFLEQKCDDLSIDYTESDTNAELCTKINNA